MLSPCKGWWQFRLMCVCICVVGVVGSADGITGGIDDVFVMGSYDG